MNFATKNKRTRILVWLIWFIALLVFSQPGNGITNDNNTPPLLGVVSHNPQNGPLFPWQPRYRWKQLALRRYHAWQRAYRRARWARLALSGAVTMAEVVNWLTSRQQHYQVGALPVLYVLLETLRVRPIINRHCPAR